MASLFVAAQECRPIENLEKVADKRLIFVGELHGTKESPQFVSDLTCGLLHMKKQVVLAVEMSSDFQPDLQSAINAPSEQQALAELEKLRFWDATMQDGKRSLAYMKLLRTAWSWKRQFPDFDVAAIDLSGSSFPSARAEFMAGEIRKILNRDRQVVVVAFTGNIHARRQKGTPWNKAFVPAASLLNDVEMVSLNMDYTAGTAWNCGGRGCGINPVSDLPVTGKSTKPSIQISQADPYYDGVYQLGEVSASPPVRQSPTASK
ncbi:MAG: hypothetical protein SF172_03395 [Burkholderiales bacterium]|nr:hypothetical protein [Burkholderiales bacterium]